MKYFKINLYHKFVNVICMLIIFVGSSAYSQQFYDDFNDGNYDGWTIIDGSWSVISPGHDGDAGAIESGSTANNSIRANVSAGFGVYEYYTKIDGESQSDSDIYINYQDSENYIRIGLHTPGDTEDHIVRTLDGQGVELTSTAQGLTQGEWAHVRVERLTDGNINVYLDGQLHMSAVDDVLTVSGDIVLRTWWYPVAFDNIYYNPSVMEFYDDFNDGNFDGWTIIDGSWAIISPGYNSDAAAIETGSTANNSIRANISVGFGVYEYYTKIDGESQSDSDIYINYQDAQNYIRIGLHTPGDTEDHIVRILDGQFTELTSTSQGLTQGEWAHVRVERFANGNIDVYLDGQLHMSAYDDILMDPGDIVLRSWWYPVVFDNVYYGNVTSGIVDKSTPLSQFLLYQNYPNPFNPTTTIKFSVKQISHVELNIYNILGQQVRTLVNDYKTTGKYSVVWDGKDNFGRLLPSGTYFYKINMDKYFSTKKMILIK